MTQQKPKYKLLINYDCLKYSKEISDEDFGLLIDRIIYVPKLQLLSDKVLDVKDILYSMGYEIKKIEK